MRSWNAACTLNTLMRCLKPLPWFGLLVLFVGCNGPTPTTPGSTVLPLSTSEAVPLDATEVIGPAYAATGIIAGANSPSGYLLSWCQDNQRVAARYSRDGSQLDAPPQLVFETCSWSQVAFGDSGYLIAQDDGSVLQARPMSTDGSLGNAQSVAFDFKTEFQLVSGTAGFLLGYTTLSDRFAVRRLASDGLPLDRTLVGDDDRAWLASNGSDYLVAWRSGDQLVAKRCPADQELDLAAATELGPWVAPIPKPQIALAFIGDRLVLSRAGYRVELFDSSLSPLGPIEELTGVIPAEHVEYDPFGVNDTRATVQTITALGDRALLAWADADSSLKAVIFDPVLGKSVGAPITVTESRGFSWRVNWTVTSADEQSLIVWDGWSGEKARVWTTGIDSSGQLDEAQPLLEGPNQQFIQAAVATNRGALATWMEWRDGSYQAFARGVSPAGEPQGESHEVFASTTGKEEPFMAWSGTQALAVWSKAGVGTSWLLLEASGQPVGELFSSTGRFAKGVASTGASFVIAEMDPLDLNLRLVLLGLDGRVEKRVLAGAHASANCGLGADDQYLLVCLEWDELNVLRFDDDLGVVGSSVSKLPDELRYTTADRVRLTRGGRGYLLTFNIFDFTYAALLNLDGTLIGEPLELGQPSSVNAAFDGSSWVLALGNQLVRLDGSDEPELFAVEDAAGDTPVLLTPTCSGNAQLFYQTGDDVSRVVTSRLSTGEAHGSCTSDEYALGGGGCSVLPPGSSGRGVAWLALGALAIALGRRKRRASARRPAPAAY
ncbi:MAG: hypothetical protein H6716_13895 [Polyangiaceae bacterium]|nr:hypothetical protein [Polyangiaceae bacterium]